MNSKGLSIHAIDQLYRRTSNDPLLSLLKFSFPVGGDLFLVNNTENITSNSQEHTAFPFKYSLPMDNDEDEPQIDLTISNVGLELIDFFRTNTSDVTAKFQLVFASNPDFIEIELDFLSLVRVSWNNDFIQASLTYDDILNISIPSYTYSPTDFPGIFNV